MQYIVTILAILVALVGVVAVCWAAWGPWPGERRQPRSEEDLQGRSFDYQRAVGALLTIGGLWHAAAPWINGYSDVTAAAISSLASGLALAAVGVAFIVLRGGVALSWLGWIVGLWVLVAPSILGFADRPLAANEALWGGPITIILVVLAACERRFSRAGPTVPVADVS